MDMEAAVRVALTLAAVDVYLLPSEGGVGVQRTLQMLLVPARQLAPATQASAAPLGPYLVRWTSSAPAIATVDQNGRVTGVRPGVATITAAVVSPRIVPPASRQSRITVGDPVAAVQVPQSLSIPQYCLHKATAQPVDSRGQPLNDRPVRWKSSAPQIVSLPIPSPTNAISLADANRIFFGRTALLLGHQVGQAVVTVTSENVSRNITVVVTASAATSLEVRPDHLVLDVQETAYATVMMRNQQGCLVTDELIAWSTDDPTVATATGLGQLQQQAAVRGLKAGTTRLTARTQGGVTASINVTIPAVSAVVLNPSQINDLDIGDQRGIVATTLSSSGTILRNRAVTWNASSGAISVQPASGYATTVTGRSVGSAVVTASCEGMSGTCSVTVPAVASVSISPASATLSVGSSTNFTATPRSSTGAPLHNRAVTWTASNNHIALQSNTGSTVRVTGISSGDATLTASCEGKSGSASIHVRTYCEDHICAPSWRVENWSDNFYDLYQMECSSAGCTWWVFVATLPPGYYYQQDGLVENDSYIVRAVTLGCDPDLQNCIKMESAPFVGGPGPVVAVFYIS